MHFRSRPKLGKKTLRIVFSLSFSDKKQAMTDCRTTKSMFLSIKKIYPKDFGLGFLSLQDCLNSPVPIQAVLQMSRRHAPECGGNPLPCSVVFGQKHFPNHGV